MNEKVLSSVGLLMGEKIAAGISPRAVARVDVNLGDFNDVTTLGTVDDGLRNNDSLTR